MISGGKRKPRYDTVPTDSPTSDRDQTDDHVTGEDPLNLTMPFGQMNAPQ